MTIIRTSNVALIPQACLAIRTHNVLPSPSKNGFDLGSGAAEGVPDHYMYVISNLCIPHKLKKKLCLACQLFFFVFFSSLSGYRCLLILY